MCALFIRIYAKNFHIYPNLKLTNNSFKPDLWTITLFIIYFSVSLHWSPPDVMVSRQVRVYVDMRGYETLSELWRQHPCQFHSKERVQGHLKIQLLQVYWIYISVKTILTEIVSWSVYIVVF